MQCFININRTHCNITYCIILIEAILTSLLHLLLLIFHYQHISLHVEPGPHPLLPLFDHLYHSHYKSLTALLDVHHLTCAISCLLHSINLVTVSSLLSPSITPLTFYSWLKTLFLSSIVVLVPFGVGLPLQILGQN